MEKRRNSFENDFSSSYNLEPIQDNVLNHTFNSINYNSLILEPSQTILENRIKKSDKSIKRLNSLDFFKNIPKKKISDLCLKIKDLKEEYLTVRELNEINEEDFNSKIIEKYNLKIIENLSEYILGLKIYINKIIDYQTISPLIDINDLIENYYSLNEEEEIKNKKEIFKDIKYYRRIKGDGNCFYRAVIFQLFENIILSNKLDYLRIIIFEIDQCYENKNNEKYLKINSQDYLKYKLCIRILISIYNKLIENNIHDAYKIFVYSLNSCIHFDLGLIWYFRYTLYKYIHENQNKLFSKNFDVLIGNLLPRKYESDGNFLFEDFYENYLLHMYSDAEKIIIYLTPYVFGIKLYIYMIEGETQIFSFEHNQKLSFNFDITIIHKKAHYELLYSFSYYENIKEFLKNYIYFEEENLIVNPDKNIDNNNILTELNLKLNKNDLIKGKKKLSKSTFVRNFPKEENFFLKKKIQKVCKNCNKFSEFLENPYNKTELCGECLKQFLISECLSQYYMFIQNYVEENEFKLSQLDIYIYGTKFKFNELFKLLQINDSRIQEKEFKNEVMTMICVDCKEIIQDRYQKIILPCDSALCNFCVEQFLKDGKEKYICPLCEEEYEKSLINQLFSIDK